MNPKNNSRSSSSNPYLPFVRKIRESTSLFWMRAKALFRDNGFENLFHELEEYQTYLQRSSGRSLATAKILEIGFGARPNRMLIMTSMGIDAIGVDLDRPILQGNLGEFTEIYKKNGLERTIKSLIRFFLFDWHERRCLRKALHKRGYRLIIDPKRFYAQNVASDQFSRHVENNSLDLVVSEDVFEHIDRPTLEKLAPAMARWLKPDGLALIRPCIYTGITGGHLVEWYPHLINQKMHRQSEPWEHLRKKRCRANTYLNEMTRSDFRKLFSSCFDIRAELVENPQLGQEFLTGQVADDLRDFPNEELFSNRVLFVLSPQS